MIGTEVAVGYVFAWLVRKAKHVGERADGEVDHALDAGVDRVGAKLHELVAGHLHGDPALGQLAVEADEGLENPSPRTAQRLALALEDATERDPQFARALDALVSQLMADSAVAGAGGLTVIGSLNIHAEEGSIAGGVINGGAQIQTPLAPGRFAERLSEHGTRPGPAAPGSTVRASGSSVAADTINGGVSFYIAPVLEVAWPVRVGVVPRAAECFQTRADVTQLSDSLVGESAETLCQVLSGPGGVGKSQLAAHYARSHSNVDVLVWVTAASREAIVSEYARAAALVTSGDMSDPQASAERFLVWLAGTERTWLVVLDDVADPGDVTGLWPPNNPTGRTVVTTRRRDAALTGAGRVRIEMDVFTPDQAAGYLRAKLAAHGRTEPADQIAGVARDLGNLPVALAQAVAYLIDTGLDCAGYRQRWADRRRSLTKLVPQGGSLPDEQRQSVAAAWSLSIERANSLEPVGLARPALELASLLDPNGIPVSVLTSRPALRYLIAHRTEPERQPVPHSASENDEDVDAETASDALAALARLSLVTLHPGQTVRTVRVHAVLQRATYDTLTRQRCNEAAQAAADALIAVWPRSDRDSALSQVLRSNADAVYRHAPDALWNPVGHPLLLRAGASLEANGLVAAAADYWREMTHASATRLGPDHPDTLTTRSRFASQQSEAGDPVGAAAELKSLLTDRLRVLGPDHPDTLSTRSKLGYWQGETGDVAGATAAFEGLLNDCLRVLGPDHPDTLSARSNLAYWQAETGDVTGAATALETLLNDYLRVLGPDHPDTMTTRSSLGRHKGAIGDVVGAVEIFKTLLTDRHRLLGPDHPDTLVTRSNLGWFTGLAGDTAGATAALEALLIDRIRVLVLQS